MATTFTGTALELLALLMVPGMGPASVLRVARGMQAAPGLLSPLWWHGQGWIRPRALTALLEPDTWPRALAAAQQALRRAERAEIRVLGLWDREYPPALRGLPDAPPVLFLRGRLPPAEDRAAAVVGTRHPSPGGRRFADAAARLLVQEGWSTVSGLALGIDTEAHRATLAAGGHTVAVLAGGLDAVYPPANAPLARAILTAGGALLSEHPPGVPPTPARLVARDRIQAGLAGAVLICESHLRGGAMHTAQAAHRYRRPLLCHLPPSPAPSGPSVEEGDSRPSTSPRPPVSFSGCRALVCQGWATAVTLTGFPAPVPGAMPLREALRRLQRCSQGATGT